MKMKSNQWRKPIDEDFLRFPAHVTRSLKEQEQIDKDARLVKILSNRTIYQTQENMKNFSFCSTQPKENVGSSFTWNKPDEVYDKLQLGSNYQPLNNEE